MENNPGRPWNEFTQLYAQKRMEEKGGLFIERNSLKTLMKRIANEKSN